MDAKEISQKLAQQADNVAQYLYPNGKKVSGNWRIGGVDGESGQSLSICLTGPQAGQWKDFQSGEGGDLIDLFAAKNKTGLSEALQHAKSFLGCKDSKVPLFVAPQISKHALVEYPKQIEALKNESPHKSYLIDSRKLSDEVLTRYQIKACGNSVLFPYLSGKGELLHWKTIGLDRENGKKKIFTSKGGHQGLYGWHALPTNTRQVIICEGEMDCLTLAMADLPVLSVPYGCQSLQWIDTEWETLEQFDDVIVALDGDDAGQNAMASIVSRLGPHRCRTLNWSEWGGKDPNELLQKGYGLDSIKAIVTEAKAQDPENLKPVSDYQEAVIDQIVNGPTNDGLELPWPMFGDKFRVRDSELTIVTGRNGSGKSQMIGQIMHHLMTQGERVCIASMEMQPTKTLHRMIQQMTNQHQPDRERIEQSFEWLTHKLWMVNVLGSIKGNELLEVFTYAHRRHGVTQFVIDSLMRCGIREDDYSGQNEFVQKLCDFKLQTKAHVWLVSHPRKGESESTAPTKLDVRGASAITDNADNVMSLWRNPDKRENLNGLELKNHNDPDARLTIGKQRNGDGWEGGCYLWFDAQSKRFNDTPPPVPSLSFSRQGGGLSIPDAS